MVERPVDFLSPRKSQRKKEEEEEEEEILEKVPKKKDNGIEPGGIEMTSMYIDIYIYIYILLEREFHLCSSSTKIFLV